jgi:hypothetical protein
MRYSGVYGGSGLAQLRSAHQMGQSFVQSDKDTPLSETGNQVDWKKTFPADSEGNQNLKAFRCSSERFFFISNLLSK